MRIVALALRFYAVLLFLALAWIYLQGRLNWNLFFPSTPQEFTLGVLFGIGIALFIIVLSLFSSRNFGWGQLLEKEFRKVLVPLAPREIVLLAGVSGFVEEFFFRGTLQPVIGIVFTSILFGVVHFVPKKVFIPWSLYATFAGFVLGSLYEITKGLVPSIIAHVLVNLVLIFSLNRQQSMQAA
jgi:membrane protease YdiL (CAAX protease family)